MMMLIWGVPHPQLMAQSCLYLACKAEETLRKVRDVINTCYFLLQPQQPMLKIGKVPLLPPLRARLVRERRVDTRGVPE
jgi:hypothetical protein